MINPLSFKSTIFVKDSQLQLKDAINLSQALRQNTGFYRPALEESLDVITSSFPNKLDPTKPSPKKPVKFFVYGCSSGLESYSIILYLIRKYGSLEEAKKRVEIHSIDLPSPGLDIAKSGKLHIDPADYSRIHRIMSLPHRIERHLIEEPELKDKTAFHNIKQEIFDYANFKEGRILEDFAPKGGFNEKEPVALFFRNSLPYIKENIAFALIENIHKKLPIGSFLSLGGYDLDYEGIKHHRKVCDTFKPVEIDGYPEKYLFRKSATRGVR